MAQFFYLIKSMAKLQHFDWLSNNLKYHLNAKIST